MMAEVRNKPARWQFTRAFVTWAEREAPECLKPTVDTSAAVRRLLPTVEPSMLGGEVTVVDEETGDVIAYYTPPGIQFTVETREGTP